MTEIGSPHSTELFENSKEISQDIQETNTEIISSIEDKVSAVNNHHAENEFASDSDEESMPDLIWPDKCKTSQANTSKNALDMTSSVSHDTGFESENASEKSTPADGDKVITEQLAKSEKGDDAENKSNDKVEKEAAEKNDEEDSIDILGNGLLRKKTLVSGKGIDTRPNSGDTVTLKVEGLLEDGTSVDKGEITFFLNDGDVILAFDLAVALMEEGEKCELFTDTKYAYGSLGRSPDIPKDASITYTLELLNIQPSHDVSSMTFDERLKFGEAKRERGNYLFGRNEYSGAINSYNKGIKVLDDPYLNVGLDEASSSLLTESWVKCYNNLAACQLKNDAFDAAIKSCEKVLSVQESNVKALFRLGKAYGAKGEIDKAITYLRRAIKLDPESKMLHQEMLNLTRRKDKETATERELYQRMFGVKPGEIPGPKNKNKTSNGLLKWTLVVGGLAAVLASVGLTWYRTS